ncbi:MAG: DUF177 domain-containing protein [Thermodesulfobacteriota bacterium]|nr:DUF177 domain-containing protein [Thermodesulfobacteriota bacterium]
MCGYFLLSGFSVKVAFQDICKSGNRYEVSDDSWFSESELYRIALVQAELILKPKGDSRVEVQGFLRTGVRLACDRCLADYDFPVDVNFHLVLEVPADENWHLKELECSGTDLDTVLLSEPVVDCWDILRQQLYLSLPDKQLCSMQCRGLCPVCGIDLNTGGCPCVPEQKESPFAVLAALKKK